MYGGRIWNFLGKLTRFEGTSTIQSGTKSKSTYANIMALLQIKKKSSIILVREAQVGDSPSSSHYLVHLDAPGYLNVL